MQQRNVTVTAAAPASKTNSSTNNNNNSSARAPQRFISPQALQKNVENIAWARGVVALAGAAACGIIGLTGIWGFVLYIVQHVLISAVLLAGMKCKPQDYLSPAPSALTFVTGGVAENLVMWLLVWTLFFALCHLYA